MLQITKHYNICSVVNTILGDKLSVKDWKSPASMDKTMGWWKQYSIFLTLTAILWFGTKTLKSKVGEIFRSAVWPKSLSKFNHLRRVKQQQVETWHPAKCKTELIRTGRTSYTHARTHTHQSVRVFTLNKQTHTKKQEGRDNAGRETKKWGEWGEIVGKTARITQEWWRSDRENDRQRSSERQRERYRHREMETMRGETKQVAWVIAWGI